MISPRDVIQKKRDQQILTAEEIQSFVTGYMSSEIADYHVAAFLMAVFLNGMELDETVALTRAMLASGMVLNLSSIKTKKIDKHSTGGVGDKTSMIVTPIAAACGVTVPMVTGRALGHTGGTLDKLESISGFDPRPSADRILPILRSVGAVIMGQTDDLAPADRRMYALRDVTATVESIPLITASILSKKLTEDLDGLVLDVKAGSGAFMRGIEEARDLARSIVDVGQRLKTKIVVLITDMEQPLGRTIGNALEIRECVEFLNGRGPEDLETLSIALSAHMIRLGGRAKSIEQAKRLAYEAISTGAAANKFRQIIKFQGGDQRVVTNPDLLPSTTSIQEFQSLSHGYVTRCDARLLGLASNALGAGRNRIDDVVDPAVGICLEKKYGEPVKRGDVLCRIHWNDQERLQSAMSFINQAFEVRTRPPKQRPLIHAVLEGWK